MIILSKLCVCAFGSVIALAVVSRAQEAAPGTINCVEGHVALDSQAVAADTVGAAAVHPGHLLETAQGKAEVHLSPGVFLRIGENSSIKMEAASGKELRVELVRGEALVEVDQVDHARRLDVIDKGADARVDHTGVYLFNANQPPSSSTTAGCGWKTIAGGSPSSRERNYSSTAPCRKPRS